MGWFSNLFKAGPKPFDPAALTLVAFGPDRRRSRPR